MRFAVMIGGLAACGSASAPRGPGVAPHHQADRSPPPDTGALDADGAGYRALRELGSQPYLMLGPPSTAEELLGDVPPPGCYGDSDPGSGCGMRAPAALIAPLGPLPATVSLLTSEGPCEATVGAPEIVDTTGCNASLVLAAPLTGCGKQVAPLARTGSAWAPALRWHAAPLPVDTESMARVDAYADPVHRAQVQAWRVAQDGRTIRSGYSARVGVDLGEERLESIVAGFLVGDDPDECQWEARTEGVVGLRDGDVLAPLAGVPTTWDGAISANGRLLGVVAGGPYEVSLHRRGDPEVAAEVVFTDVVWRDNDECAALLWAEVPYPCGP